MLADIEAELGQLIDYDAFSKKVLKRTWPELDKRDRERFKASFKSLVNHTYAKRFKPGTRFEWKARGAPSCVDEAGTVCEVLTIIEGKKAAADVDYSTHHDGGAWAVTDITIDGVSMALNWRGQFRKIIDKQGFDVLVEKIDSKVSKLKKRASE